MFIKTRKTLNYAFSLCLTPEPKDHRSKFRADIQIKRVIKMQTVSEVWHNEGSTWV